MIIKVTEMGQEPILIQAKPLIHRNGAGQQIYEVLAGHDKHTLGFALVLDPEVTLIEKTFFLLEKFKSELEKSKEKNF